MALSVSRDRTLRLWNLLEGRCAYVKRLQGEGELVRWSPAGDTCVVQRFICPFVIFRYTVVSHSLRIDAEGCRNKRRELRGSDHKMAAPMIIYDNCEGSLALVSVAALLLQDCQLRKFIRAFSGKRLQIVEVVSFVVFRALIS